jgi:hypothetical protein
LSAIGVVYVRAAKAFVHADCDRLAANPGLGEPRVGAVAAEGLRWTLHGGVDERARRSGDEFAVEE